MMDHNEAQMLISRMLDEELSPSEQSQLQQHLQVCAECRGVYSAFSSLTGTLREDLEEPPEALRENVMGEIRREEIRKKNLRLRRRAERVAAAAAVLILAVALSPRLRMGSVKGSAVTANVAVASAAVQEIQTPEAMEEATETAAERAVNEAAPAVPAAGAPAAPERAMMTSDEAPMEAARLYPLQETLAFLEGEESDFLPDREADLCLNTEDGELTLWFADGAVYYRLGDSEQIWLSPHSPEEVLEFVQNFE